MSLKPSKSSNSRRQSDRRRRKWVRGDLQLKIILTTFSVMLAVLSVAFLASVAGLLIISRNLAATPDAVLRQAQDMLFKTFFVSALIAVPLSLWVGITYIFTICGPIYRFKEFFVNLKNGRWDDHCVLRKDDDLHDVGEAINDALAMVREKLWRQQRLLGQVEPLLSNVAPEHAGAAQELRRELDREAAEFELRFGRTEATARQTSQPIPQEELTSS